MHPTYATSLDPAYAGETTNLFIHINTYDTLVDIRPDDLNTIVPRLADWCAVDMVADGLIIYALSTRLDEFD